MKHLQSPPKLTLDTTTADQLLITVHNLYQKNNYETIVTLLSNTVDCKMSRKNTPLGNDLCYYIKWLGAAHYMLKHFKEANNYFEYLSKYYIDDEVSTIWQDTKKQMATPYKQLTIKQQENLLVNALDFVYNTAYSHFANKEYQKAIDILNQVISDQYEFNKFNRALLDLHFKVSSELISEAYQESKQYNSAKQAASIPPQTTTTSPHPVTISPPPKASESLLKFTKTITTPLKTVQGDYITYSPNYYELIKVQTLIGQNNYKEAHSLIQTVLENTNTTEQDIVLANKLLKSIPIEQQGYIHTDEQQAIHESKKQKPTPVINDEALSLYSDEILGQDDFWNIDPNFY